MKLVLAFMDLPLHTRDVIRLHTLIYTECFLLCRRNFPTICAPSGADITGDAE
jgi:hypothetical protein